jgi:hypothetical protein
MSSPSPLHQAFEILLEAAPPELRCCGRRSSNSSRIPLLRAYRSGSRRRRRPARPGRAAPSVASADHARRQPRGNRYRAWPLADDIDARPAASQPRPRQDLGRSGRVAGGARATEPLCHMKPRAPNRRPRFRHNAGLVATWVGLPAPRARGHSRPRAGSYRPSSASGWPSSPNTIKPRSAARRRSAAPCWTRPLPATRSSIPRSSADYVIF